MLAGRCTFLPRNVQCTYWGVDVMHAVTGERYGPPEGLEVREVERPVPGPGQVLVRVHAAAVNPIDWRLVRGWPYVMRPLTGLLRPKGPVPGVDVAGTVESVGERVTQFAAGDAVFGACAGGLAEFALSDPDRLALMPADLGFAQAAAVPMAGCTAWQALHDHGRVQRGDRVVINGAAGGVGTFAVQIAKAAGAEVTGVCSAANVDFVRSLGADHVVDYLGADFAGAPSGFDVVLDAVGNRRAADLIRSARPDGTVVVLGGGGGRALGPLSGMVAARVVRSKGRRVVLMMTTVREADLRQLATMVASGGLRPVVELIPLTSAPAAIGRLEAGHVRGKIVVTVAHDVAS